MPVKFDAAISAVGLVVVFGLLFIVVSNRTQIDNEITIGVTDLSFHRIAASLVYNVLKDEGYKVKRVYAPHEENFRKLEAGETDMLASAWLPFSHGEYMEEVEKTVPLMELGLHYKPYALWGVPDYVPEDQLSEVSDLLKPEVANKTRKLIQGINEGAGISRFSVRMMEEYELEDAGYYFRHGTEEECVAAFEDAVAEGEWVVVPLWKPHFLHHIYTIRELKDPMGLLGGVDEAVLLLREDRKSLLDDDDVDDLDDLHWSNEIIAELDYYVSRQGRPIDEVTKEWLDSHADTDE